MNKEQGLFTEPHSPDNYAKWVMPRIDIDTIYKIGTFEFKRHILSKLMKKQLVYKVECKLFA